MIEPNLEIDRACPIIDGSDQFNGIYRANPKAGDMLYMVTLGMDLPDDVIQLRLRHVVKLGMAPVSGWREFFTNVPCQPDRRRVPVGRSA